MSDVNEVRNFIRDHFDASERFLVRLLSDVPGVLLVEVRDSTSVFQVSIDVVDNE